ncbi:collagenase [Microbulbifer salipaludis]|uniref:Collagenase n=1 Tax=Microbulbifer salipaludis TaxID=187980 RepID=A0ABS3E6F4_9GAMM|nr:collagenase [Microbulbifer salipaludis]MBN8430879.1 collagenase [Microbulbifer salipaludis]
MTRTQDTSPCNPLTSPVKTARHLSLVAASLLSALAMPGTAADIDQVLPIQHSCSSTLKIRAQDMTASQLNATCADLSAEEALFHQRLQTNQVPVPNDFNSALRVVVFDDYTQYDTYGYDLFGINTNNGGIYIEGTPSNPDNQASFYAHEASWLRPEFAIWNLEHEYVHYLDGRFIAYGGFNHYPGNMVWWSEGLAEYLSLGNDNPEAIAVARNHKPRHRKPSLASIFDTTYRDKTDQVYRWSYLAIRFLFERHYDEVIAMTNTLKNNDYSSYTAYLNNWQNSYESEYQNWLDGLVNSGAKGAPRNSKRDQMLMRHSAAEAKKRGNPHSH